MSAFSSSSSLVLGRVLGMPVPAASRCAFMCVRECARVCLAYRHAVSAYVHVCMRGYPCRQAVCTCVCDHLHVCLCEHVWLRMHLCACKCVVAFVCVHTHVVGDVCMPVCHMHDCVFMCESEYSVCVFKHACELVCASMLCVLCFHMSVFECGCLCVHLACTPCVHVCLCACVCVY